jgi:hypothetical protein
MLAPVDRNSPSLKFVARIAFGICAGLAMVMPWWKNLLPWTLFQQNKATEGKLCT